MNLKVLNKFEADGILNSFRQTVHMKFQALFSMKNSKKKKKKKKIKMFSAADVIRALSFTTQWANSADDKMMIFFFFFFFPVTRI